MLNVIFFAMVDVALGMEKSEDDTMDGFGILPSFIIMTGRSAIGDVRDLSYETWSKIGETKHNHPGFSAQSHIMIVLILTAWVLNVYLNFLILMNFLIAAIGESYEKYNQNKVPLAYSTR